MCWVGDRDWLWEGERSTAQNTRLSCDGRRHLQKAGCGFPLTSYPSYLPLSLEPQEPHYSTEGETEAEPEAEPYHMGSKSPWWPRRAWTWQGPASDYRLSFAQAQLGPPHLFLPGSCSCPFPCPRAQSAGRSNPSALVNLLSQAPCLASKPFYGTAAHCANTPPSTHIPLFFSRSSAQWLLVLGAQQY